MSKLKKFLLLIPTAFIMLLNCMSFTAFAIDDFSQYFKNPEDYPEILEAYDYTDYEKVFRDTFGDMPEKYLLYACADSSFSSYVAGYMTGKDDLFSIYCVDLTDVETDLSEYSLISTTPATIYKATYHLSDRKFYFDDNFAVADDLNYFKYFSETAHFVFKDTPYIHTGSLATQSRIDVYSFFIFTNHPDIHLPDFAGGSDILNVSVSVEPELSLNHRFTYSEASSISPGFTLTITNNSNRPIQYKMNIHSADATIFKYYKYDWVYTEVDSQISYVNKSTCHHYVPAKSSDSVFFSYQNINFSSNVVYYLLVEYCFSLDDSATELFTNQANYNGNYFLDSEFAAEMYNDSVWFEFSFLDFPFLYKRPSNSDSLYLPYDSQIDQDRYETSYNASLNDDGTIDYTGKAPDDFYVWDNNDIIYSSSSGVIGGSSSGSSNDGTFKSFASSFNGFFKFISYLFNYLPVGIKNLFLCGFTGIIVIAFVKKVF